MNTALSEQIAALQNRIEELEAVISKKDEIFREILSANTKLQAENLATDALSIKAGDVQAPKEGWRLVPIEANNSVIDAFYEQLENMGYSPSKVDITIDETKLLYKAMIAAAPTDTEGK